MNPTEPVAGFGEVLLRLKSVGAARLLQDSRLEALFGGAEFNVLAQLARFGEPTQLVTCLPTNALGDAALEEIRRQGVGTLGLRRTPGRMGLYFLESGADIRPARVIYDRADSAFARLDPGEFDWSALLCRAGWLHLSGITAALGDATCRAAVDAARTARCRGVPVSVDVNSRPTLWAATSRRAIEHLPALLAEATLVFAGTGDSDSCLLDAPASDDGDGAPERFLDRMLQAYPATQAVVSVSRRAAGADVQELSAIAAVRNAGLLRARTITLHKVVDRIGAGDALAAGCIHGLRCGWTWPRLLDFGVAAGALKHTVPGDAGRASREEIEALLAGEDGGRVQR